MIDEYETEVILAPTRPEMVEIMEDGLDLLAEHCGCTYTVKTKSQGNYEAVIDAGGGMYYRVLMEMNESDIRRENITFQRGYMEDGSFVSTQSTGIDAIAEAHPDYASLISVNNGAAWIFCYWAMYSSFPAVDGHICMRGVNIKSETSGDTYLAGSAYVSSNERQMWPDTNDSVNLPNGTSRVYAIDNFDNARYCVPDGKAMLYPSLISFDYKRHLGIPTIGDEPVYWLVREYRIAPWREFYVGGVKYVTLGHVAFRSLEREEET